MSQEDVAPQARRHRWQPLLSSAARPDSVLCLTCGSSVPLAEPELAARMTGPCSVGDSGTASEDALIAQLEQLNERSRWYSQQAWQVPFAFLGVAALIANAASGAGRSAFVFALVAIAVLGAAVWVHARYMRQRAHRAVGFLQSVEAELGLSGKAIKGGSDYWVLTEIVLLTALVAGVWSLLLISGVLS